MTVVLLAVVVAIVLAVAFRGSVNKFGQPRTQRNGMLAFAAVALGASLVGEHASVAASWLVGGAIALCVYARLNRGRPGLLLAALGLALNALVTVVNASMPVSLEAADRAGVPPSRVQLNTDPLREPLTDTTVLPWLSESIPLALPFRPAVASAGDLFVAAGAAVFLFTGLTGRGRPAPVEPERKGKRARRKAAKAAKAAAAATAAQTVDGPPAAFDTSTLEAPVLGTDAVSPSRASRAATGVTRSTPSDPFSSPRMGSDAVTAVAPAAVSTATAAHQPDSEPEAPPTGLEASPFSGSRAHADSVASALDTRATGESAAADATSLADEQQLEDRDAVTPIQSAEPVEVTEMAEPVDRAEQDGVAEPAEDHAGETDETHEPTQSMPTARDRDVTHRPGRGARKAPPGTVVGRARSDRRVAGRHAAPYGSHVATAASISADVADGADGNGEPSEADDPVERHTSVADIPAPWTVRVESAPAAEDPAGPPAAWRL